LEKKGLKGAVSTQNKNTEHKKEAAWVLGFVEDAVKTRSLKSGNIGNHKGGGARVLGNGRGIGPGNC